PRQEHSSETRARSTLPAVRPDRLRRRLSACRARFGRARSGRARFGRARGALMPPWEDGPRRRPPWWPEGEEWPPARGGWGGGGRSLGDLTAPIGDSIEAAVANESDNYSLRGADRGGGKMRSLARAFNEMGDRLEADEQTRRTLLADITHELRTPLTVIQGNL